MKTRFVAVAAVIVGCAVIWPGGLSAADVDFNRDIRPILSENCFFCHGPDANTREADLRLDRQAGALAMVTAGDRAESELFRRVSSDDADELMPPADSNRKLSARQIELLGRWIDEGASWGEHWSLTPIEKPPLPDVAEAAARLLQSPAGSSHYGDWAKHPIDRLVLARLVRQERRPSPRAGRETLIRRVTLDLTGLPPTPAEVDEFVRDGDDNAYEKVVDRLLDSPAYGERMAWNWLDAARYADSNGYQGDRERTMWPWRDWVVQAFNDNLPYDQFTVWQLAGDLLPNATFEQQLATGFCRNHMINGEGGRIAEENRVDYVMDMTETMGTVWLGLTLNCCRCHDHKYDPLTNEEYYRLFAFFNHTPVTGGGGDPQTKPVLAVPSAEQREKIQGLEDQLAGLKRELQIRRDELGERQTGWERQQLEAASRAGGVWRLLKPTAATAEHQTLAVQPDQSILAGGPNPENDTYRVTATTDLRRLTAVRLEALRDESHTQNSLSRADSGNFVLTEFEVSIQPGEQPPRRLTLDSAEATFEQSGHKVAAAFDGNAKTGWAVYEGRVVDREHAAVFRFDKPVELREKDRLVFVLRHESPHRNHNLGRFRLSATDVSEPKLQDEGGELLAALRVPPAERNAEQRQRIASAHQKADAEYGRLEVQHQKLERELTSLQNALPKVMVMQDMPEPRATYLLTRGLYNQPGKEVTAGVPASLPPLAEGEPPNRLALARWLVSDANPLTARVTVNRFWQQLFGMGLVKTPEDFGVQGEIPPHLDLLNWLAADFRDRGWDVKALMKSIVMSQTYRQSSLVRETLADDPDNRLLARGPRFRMPFWMLRDQALAASGLLVRQIGGPPVNGYQPPGVWEGATFGKKKYTQDHGDALYRRSLYTFWRRIIAPTMFFDNASRQTCTVEPFRTNTPLHVLLTMNDVTFVEAARALAERALHEDTDDAGRLRFVFRRVLARSPKDAEQSVLLGGLKRSRREFSADRDAAASLLAVGESGRDEQLDAVEHASWTSLCLAVLNLDEALTKE